MKKVRVLVVDDSIFFRKVLTDRLSEYPNIEIAGTATDAIDANQKIPQLNPDVITMDVEMPRLSGIEFLKQLIPVRPLPVVLVSSLNIGVFDALSAGAVDFVRKPDMQQQNNVERFIDELGGKVIIASQANVKASQVASPSNASPNSSLRLNHTAKADRFVIALGASTGGTEATLTVLKQLPADTPGLLIVQHMPPGFTKMYADRLDRLCAMEVREAKTGDKVRRGLALVAPGDAHLKLVRIGTEYSVQCTPGEKVSGHCPSVDVLFQSVAKTAGANSVGIILTGMGRDGAAGLLAMRKSGAYTIGQDRASSVVYGMPMEAYDIGAVVKQASCESIPYVLKTYLNQL